MTDNPSTLDLIREMNERTRQLDEALAYLKTKTIEWAAAEHSYRKQRAGALVATAGSVALKEAMADVVSVDTRKERDLALGLKEAALEAVRSRRAQLSAVQSIANAVKTEIEMAR